MNRVKDYYETAKALLACSEIARVIMAWHFKLLDISELQLRGDALTDKIILRSVERNLYNDLKSYIGHYHASKNT